jgi:DNA end-binding protein Ku
MARTIWKGALSFGLVNVPVGLYPATQDKAIHFNQLEEGTSDRIRYKKVNERTGNEVDNDQIVKGYDLGGGEYVILTDEELESAEPERTRLIDISDFVDQDDIDPIYYRTTYYLAPEGEAGEKAYALLRQAMRDSKKIAIGTIVMRNKEYPVAIRPDDNVLNLETMYFADEIRAPGKDLPELPSSKQLTKREVSMAEQLIESMESEWDPGKYHDTHREKVEDLIEAKRQGNEVVVRVAAPEPTKVVDLMDVLSASIKSVKEGGTGNGRRRSTSQSAAAPAAKKRAPAGSAKKRAPTRKAAAKPTSITAKSATKAGTKARRKAS